jgi:rubredoxin
MKKMFIESNGNIKMKCCRDIIFGPGCDDYGRDNILEDWECPECHKMTKFTSRDVRMGINVCPKCGWMSDMARIIDESLNKLPRRIKNE